jgi:uncharacterized membrane protein
MDFGTSSESSEMPEAASSHQPGDSASARIDTGLNTPIDLRSLLREAWTIFAAAWPACLVVYWGAGSASWLILYVLTMTLAGLNVMIGEHDITPFLEFIRFLGLFLVPAWLWVGQSLAFLKLARKQPVALGDLFRGGPYLLTTLLATGLLLAIVAVPCVLIYGSAEALIALGGGDSLVAMVRQLLPTRTPEPLANFESTLLVLLALALVLAGLSYAAFFAVTVRLGQFPFLIIDRGAGVFESLRMSMQLTRERAATVFLVYLAQFTINLAGLLVCYVGLFVSLPLTSLISAVTYNALCGGPEPESETEDDDQAS